MSRIFDALQRSGTEQSGIEYPDVVSVATEVFEAPRDPVPDKKENSDPRAASQTSMLETLMADFSIAPVSMPEVAVPQVPAATVTIPHDSAVDEASGQIREFPSLQVNVTPSSRLVFFTEPDSLAAEKVRFLGVRLRQIRQNRTLKKVLITSTIPAEGKSLISANLAGVLARRKEKVLLLEGDLRRPVLAQQFGLGRLAGLGEWLQSGQQSVSNVYHLGGPGFWLMPAGSPPANPTELMQSGRLSLLMENLAEQFDWVIVDSPPLLPLADTSLWIRLADGTVLVTREGVTEKGPLQRGLELLKKSDLLGVVLNSCSAPEHTDYYYYSPKSAK